MFKTLDHANNSLYKVELAKTQIEHKEPVTVGFFILQYAKLRLLGLYYNCDVNKLEELEIDKDSLYLALGEKELEVCIRPELRAEWPRLGSNECVDSFTADAPANLSPRTCCVKHIPHDRRDPGLFKEEFRCTEMLCMCIKSYCCYYVTSNYLMFSSKCLNKSLLEQSSNGLLDKYRRVLNQEVNVTSNKRRFQTNNHSVDSGSQNRLRKVSPTFTQSEQSRVIEFTLTRSLCRLFTEFSLHNVVYLSNFIPSKKSFQI